MVSTVFDSFYLKDRFGTSAMRDIWNDRATLQRWLDVEVALARVEAELGLIPEKAALQIARAARIEKLDLPALKKAFDETWNPVVPLVDELRKKISKRSAGFVHWGATSKNIFDTGLMLQVRSSYDVVETHLWSVADRLAELAETHRDTVMAGRTHGQHALPVTLGFKAAVWLDELLRNEERLEDSRRRVLVGEFGGAVGTLASLGKNGLRVQKRLMEQLGLSAAEVPVKTSGDRIAEFVLVLCMLSSTLGKIAQNIYNLQQTDVDEVMEFTEGKVGSSAMPHKQNPVASGSVVLLGRLLRGNATAALDYIHAEGEDDHRQGETAWKFVPEVCLLADAQLTMSERLLATLIVKPDNMQSNLERAGALVCSEAILMRLAPTLGRDRAHGHVQSLSARARSERRSLREVAEEDEIIRSHLSSKEIARSFDYGACLGETRTLVRRVLKAYKKRAAARR